MDIIIKKTPTGDIYTGQYTTFSIVSGISNCLEATYEWYINTGTTDFLIGTGTEFSYIFMNPGYFQVYLKVYDYCETFWHGGQFYGGVFRGDFGGGTFNYGDLNGCIYNELLKKPKPFIVNITGSGKK